MKVVEYRLHDLKQNLIHGPFQETDELFQAVQDMNLHDPYFVVTKVEVSTELFIHDHALSMWLHKKKSKKTKDVDAEVVKPEPITIEAELIG
jgi:hypothetical protein